MLRGYWFKILIFFSFCLLSTVSRKSRNTASSRSYGSSSSSGSGGGLMKVSPDTVCTLEKRSRRNGNDHCFEEQECSPRCRTVNEQQCNTLNKQECTTVQQQQCNTVNKQQCSTVQEQQCRTVQ